MANPYLAFSALLMAGIDGIQNRIEPPKPIDKDLYELPPRGARRHQADARFTSRDAGRRCKEDHEFLLKGDVFTKELIDSYIEYKLLNECDAVDLRPASVRVLSLRGRVVFSSTCRRAAGGSFFC